MGILGLRKIIRFLLELTLRDDDTIGNGMATIKHFWNVDPGWGIRLDGRTLGVSGLILHGIRPNEFWVIRRFHGGIYSAATGLSVMHPLCFSMSVLAV